MEVSRHCALSCYRSWCGTSHADDALMQVADALIHDKEPGAGAAAMSPAVSMGGNSIGSQGSAFQEAGKDLPWPTVHRTG